MANDGTQSVGLAATAICPNSSTVTLQNMGATTVEIGGPGVSVGTFVVQLPANMPEPLILNEPPFNIPGGTIFGITVTAPVNVVYHTSAYGA